jgi:RNase H-fold protein (predicted Holliday junction resolvase)
MDTREQTEGPILAIDPGRDKCGAAVMGRDRKLLHQAIVPTSEIAVESARMIREFGVSTLIVGDRTSARAVCRALAAEVSLPPVMVDEHRSTERARGRFFEANPPRGWRRLLPVTLLTPSRQYDDYAAVLLAEEYLASQDSRA